MDQNPGSFSPPNKYAKRQRAFPHTSAQNTIKLNPITGILLKARNSPKQFKLGQNLSPFDYLGQEMLLSVEEKWIRNEITKDTYQRWYSNYNEDILNLKASIERLGKDQNYAFNILKKNLDLLTDMRYVYTAADTMQKREFVARVFDNNLSYSEGIY